jgi:hypothetical protein
MNTETVLKTNYGIHTKKKYSSDWLVQMAVISGRMLDTYETLYRLDNPQHYADSIPQHSYQWYKRYYERLYKLELALVQHTGFAILGKPVWENLSHAHAIEFGDTKGDNFD